MTDATTLNNVLTVRGRVLRDAHFAKDGKKAVMFAVAAARNYTNPAGDAVTATDYVDVKVFNDAVVEQLQNSGLKKGTIVKISARASAELNIYEKEGQSRTNARLIAYVENGADHSVQIDEMGQGEESNAA